MFDFDKGLCVQWPTWQQIINRYRALLSSQNSPSAARLFSVDTVPAPFNDAAHVIERARELHPDQIQKRWTVQANFDVALEQIASLRPSDAAGKNLLDLMVQDGDIPPVWLSAAEQINQRVSHEPRELWQVCRRAAKAIVNANVAPAVPAANAFAVDDCELRGVFVSFCLTVLYEISSAGNGRHRNEAARKNWIGTVLCSACYSVP
jgi:hypothetical protein